MYPDFGCRGPLYGHGHPKNHNRVTHMKAPLPGHLETSPSEAHARGCGPVGLAGYKRDPIGRAHSTIWGEGILSRWNGRQIWDLRQMGPFYVLKPP